MEPNPNLIDPKTEWQIFLEAYENLATAAGRDNVIIIKDKIGCEYRALSGSPVDENVTDVQLLEAFEGMPS